MNEQNEKKTKVTKDGIRGNVLLPTYFQYAEELIGDAEVQIEQLMELSANERSSELAKEGLQQILRSAHHLKGMAAIVGIEEDKRCAARLEERVMNINLRTASATDDQLAEMKRNCAQLREGIEGRNVQTHSAEGHSPFGQLVEQVRHQTSQLMQGE